MAAGGAGNGGRGPGPRRDGAAGWAALLATLAGLAAAPAAGQALLATGSGFLVNEAGWVLTNAHVVEGCDALEVQGLGRARTVIVDGEADLALALFPGPHEGAPLALRKAPPRLTEAVVAVGFPLTDILGDAVRATTGTVSSLAGMQGDPRYFQMSAPIQAGNSGGPVLDASGAVVGVASATISEEAYQGSQNVNFAVTAREAARFIGQHGLGYARAPDGGEGAGPEGDPGGDPVERATAVTYLIQCLSDAAPGGFDPGVPPQDAPAVGMVAYDGLDVLGFDYATLRDLSVGGCQASCEADGACRAFTYNARHGVCFLKSDAVVLVENGDAVGGFDADLEASVVDSGLVVESDVDSPGGDYAQITGSDFVGCAWECGADPACQAFAFVRESGNCWLKDRIGPLQSVPGVEFGSRR